MRDHRASHTAIIVAKSQALSAASGEATVPLNLEASEFSRRALEVAGHGQFVRALQSKTFRRVMRLYESVMIPGLAKHHVLRKNYIESKVRDALQSGVQQVIQVGAGLDSLCYRLHQEWAGKTFIEFDQPATQDLKHKVLDTFECDENLLLKPLDLGKPDPGSFAQLIGNGAPTIIVVEGVLMYLPPNLVAAWLRNWQRWGGLKSRLLFTFMEKSGFRKQSAAVNGWLKLAGEPFRWHANRRSAKTLLRETGWEPNGEHATWWEAGGRGAAEGEWIGEALRRSNPV